MRHLQEFEKPFLFYLKKGSKFTIIAAKTMYLFINSLTGFPTKTISPNKSMSKTDRKYK